jgi:hypothetical protein
MDITHEVYGEEIWAKHQGDESYQIIEQDDGSFNFSHETHTNFADFDEWSDIEKHAITYARGNILDITPGAGASSIYLQNQGFNVTAAQPSHLANKVCIERGLKNSHVLSVDMVDTLGSKKFDTIIMFGNHFGLFNSVYQSKKLFQKLFQISNPGATILIENNYSIAEDNSIESDNAELDHWIQDIPVPVRMRIRFKHHISEWFNHLLFSEKQLQNILENTGWRVQEIIESDNSSYIGVLQKSA